MKIWFFSDTHENHMQLDVPDCDMAIFCGDESNSKNPGINSPQCDKFYHWYDALNIEHKIAIAGNHSAAIFTGLINPNDDFKTIHYLEHGYVEIEEIKIFGSPYTPSYNNWYFNVKRSRLHDYWKVIPEDIDILATHGPPFGKLDMTLNYGDLTRTGCSSLLKHVLRVKPDIHAFGHLHSEATIDNYGILEQHGIKFVNAACSYLRKKDLTYSGHVIEYN